MENKYGKSGMHFDAPPSVFKNAMHLREGMTVAEEKLWMFLKSYASGYKFRRQHPIGGYILDFYCHKLRLSIEFDGEYNQSEMQMLKDAERTQYINDLGIFEIRFSNHQIFDEWDKVVKDLQLCMKELNQNSIL